MKRIIFFSLLVLFLSGCATYKFQKGQPPYNKGYVASRDGYTIVEYTIGRENTVAPNVALAKERFKRRRRIVEDYYKRMGAIENRFKQAVVDYPVMLFKLAFGVFKMPGIAISDYRYNHNPKYKERMDKLEEKKEAREEARIKKLKDALNIYVEKDLQKEQSKLAAVPQAQEASQETQAPALKNIEPKPEIPAAQKIEQKEEKVESKMESAVAQKAEPVEEKIVPKPEAAPAVQETAPKEEKRELKISETMTERQAPSGIKAVIVASPKKGFSPLRVHFSGSKSHSKSGKIISYSWGFGDGDSSTKVNPVNTYYSGSFEPKEFTVSLTVWDNSGNTATSNTVITVLNK